MTRESKRRGWRKLATAAPLDEGKLWTQINWSKVSKHVYRLQLRIAQAVRAGCMGAVKRLQRLLTRSWAGKLLATRRVTQNKGKSTPGVDGAVWTEPEEKLAAARALKRRGYRARPLRRVYIPKSNGKQRPLGIPTMHDRSMQALYQLALEPVSESLADANSYGFRPKRGTADAIGQCFVLLAKKVSPTWVLDADIKACFDRIDHEWLCRHVPLDTGILKTWLKAGYMEQKVFHHTHEGTPQGGIISPGLANMTLDGLEGLMSKVLPAYQARRIHLVRYADDFIITAPSKECLETHVLPAVRAFLAERGLLLSEEKTRIVPIHEGFDFLGFNLRKYGGKLLIKPQKEKVLAFVREITSIVRGAIHQRWPVLVRRLNQVLRGWAYYYRAVVAKHTFSFVDKAVRAALWRWMARRHPKQSVHWRRARYCRRQAGSRWVYSARERRADGTWRRIDVFSCASLPIRRHVKIQSAATPFDPQYEAYFRRRHVEQRRVRHLDREALAKYGMLS